MKISHWSYSSIWRWFAVVASFLVFPPGLYGQIATNALSGRVLVKLLSDPSRPVVYGLNSGNGLETGSVLALDASTGSVVAEVGTGRNPTDMVLTASGDALYVINTGSRTIGKYRLAPLALERQQSITTPGTYDTNNPLHIASGRNGRLYHTDGAWAPSVTIFDFNTGIVLGKFDDGNGVGGVTSTRDGSFLYVWRQFGWSAGMLNSYVTRLDASGSVPVALENSFSSWRRDPFDTPLLLDAGERWLFNKQQMFDARDVSKLIQQFSENLYAISLDGTVTLGTTKAFRSLTGEELFSFGFASTVQALSTDQKRLFRYSSSPGLVLYDMNSIASVAGPEMAPAPADEAILGDAPKKLSWTPSLTAVSYQVYLSTNATEVANAQKGSPVYLGSTSSLSLDISSALGVGVPWYWRVDAVGSDGQARTGHVWRFTVSPLQITPNFIPVDAIRGYNPAPSEVWIHTDGIPWSARVMGDDWIQLSQAQGQTGARLILKFSTESFASGIKTNGVEINFPDGRVIVPIQLSVTALNINRMAADPGRPYLYATQPGSLPGQPGKLLFIHTGTGTIERILPIGGNPTDLAVHVRDRRLFVANWGLLKTEVVDLDRFELLEPLQLGTDVYRINAGPTGRMVVEGYDQWIGVSLLDNQTGAKVSDFPFPQREGDGETSPDGLFYYHCDNNISNAAIHKYSMSGTIAAVAHSSEHPYGSRSLVMSGDGSRIFWQGAVFDADLHELGTLGVPILAASKDGSIAVSSEQAYDTQAQLPLAPLPYGAATGVVDGEDRRFWYFQTTTGTLKSVDLNSLRAPTIAIQPTSQLRISQGSPLYLTVTARGMSPLSYQWTHSGTNLPGSTNAFLSIEGSPISVDGGVYSVIVTNRFGAAESNPSLVTILAPPTWTQEPTSTHAYAGTDVLLSGEAIGTPPFEFVWTFNGVPIPEAVHASLFLPEVQTGQEGIYQLWVSNEAGLISSRLVSLRVMPREPVVVEGPTSQTVKAGENVQFQAQVRGTDPIALQWFFNGNPIPGATGAVLNLAHVQASSAGFYQWQGSNTLGHAISPEAQLTVLASAPFFIQQPVDTSILAGGNVTLSASLGGSEPMVLRWLHEGTPVVGGVGAALEITNVTLGQAGVYQLEATNTLGRVISSNMVLTVNAAPTFRVPFRPALTFPGERVVLQVEAAGSPNPTLIWTKNGAVLTNSGPVLELVSVGQGDSGLYAVSAINAFGTASARGLVMVQSPPSQVIAWGDDSGGQSAVPSGLQTAVAVAGGDYHSVALQADGSLVAWGYPQDGRVSVPSTERRWFAIAAGASHTLGILEDGSLAGFGNNDLGQLNFPATNKLSKAFVAVAAGEGYSAALTSFGTVLAWGDNRLGQTQIPAELAQIRTRVDDPRTPVRLAAGRHHTLALLRGGAVLAWGANLRGEAAVPMDLGPVKAVAAGFLHSVALLESGTVVVWGDNTFGQTNTPSNLNQVVAVAAGDFHTLALRSDGSVIAWGDNSFGQTTLPGFTKSVSHLAAGYYHGMALVPGIPLLRWERNRNEMKLSWEGDALLQAAPQMHGPYETLTHGEAHWGPFSISGSDGQFFRLVAPGPR